MNVELRRADTRAVLSPDGSIRVHMRNKQKQKQKGGGAPKGLELEQELRLIEEELERRRPFANARSNNSSDNRSDDPSPVHRQHIDTAWSASPHRHGFTTPSPKTSMAYDLAMHASQAVPAFSSDAILSPRPHPHSRPHTSNARLNGSQQSRSFFTDGDELVSEHQQQQEQRRPSSAHNVRMETSPDSGDGLSQRIQQFKFRVQGNRRPVAGLSEGEQQNEHSPLQQQEQRQNSALFVSADGHIGRFETPVMPQVLSPQSDVCRPVLVSPPRHTVGIARLPTSRQSSSSSSSYGEMVQSPLAHLQNESDRMNKMNGWDTRQNFVPTPPSTPPPIAVGSIKGVQDNTKVDDQQQVHQLSQAREEEERYREELKQLEQKLSGLETEQARSQRQRRDSDSKLKQADSVVGRLNTEIQKLQRQLKVRDTKIHKLAQEKAIAEATAKKVATKAAAALASAAIPAPAPPPPAMATPVTAKPKASTPPTPPPVDTSAVPPSPNSMPSRAASAPAPAPSAPRSPNLSRTMSSTVDVAHLSRTKLKEGMVFMKHGKHGKPHLRFVCLSEDSKNMLYGPTESVDDSKTNKIPVESITAVKKGHMTDVFKRSKRGRAHACFSIITAGRTLDLEIVPFGPMTTTRKHLESDARDFWVTAIKLLSM